MIRPRHKRGTLRRFGWRGRTVMVGGAILVIGLIHIFTNTGLFLTIKPHFDGRCSEIAGVIGAEDMAMDGSVAYVSSMDWRTWMRTGHGVGAIYIYRAGSHAAPIRLPNDYSGPFHPHGIGLWKGQDGAADRLFVVNHPTEGKGPLDANDIVSEVLIFEVGEGGLHFIRKVPTSDDYSLNDVTPVGPDRFYASIDRGSTSHPGKVLEQWLKLPKAGIAYGSENGMRFLVGGLIYANGIHISPDGATLFVSETTGARINAYARNKADDSLKKIASRSLHSGLDNIMFGADGTLYIGSHPKLFAFLGHAADAAKMAPAQVLTVTFDGKAFSAPREIYLSNGNPLSAVSVAAPYPGGMLLGGVFDPLMLDCSMKPEPAAAN